MRHARPDYNGRIVDLQNKIPEAEPVFLIRGQDVLGPNTVRFWAKRLEEIGGDPAMVAAAKRQAEAMLDWQTEHNFKTPDMPAGSGEVTAPAPPTDLKADIVAWFKRMYADQDWDCPENVIEQEADALISIFKAHPEVKA